MSHVYNKEEINMAIPISYNMKGAVEVSGFSRSRLYEAMKDGELKFVKLRRRTFILHDELERYVKATLGVA